MESLGDAIEGSITIDPELYANRWLKEICRTAIANSERFVHVATFIASFAITAESEINIDKFDTIDALAALAKRIYELTEFAEPKEL